MDEIPLLIIDDREDKERIKQIVRRWPHRFEVKRIPIGDYLLTDHAFEMKTIADFLASMRDGRLFQQTRELDLNAPGKAFLVLCGSPEEAKYARPEWRYDADAWERQMVSFRGAIWSILEKREVGIIWVKNPAEFVDFLIAKAKRLQKGERTSERPVLTLKGNDRTTVQEASDVLAAISGIGRQAADGLLGHFGSIAAVAAADVKELAKAPGIGRVRAEHVKSILTTKHQLGQTI